MKVNANITLNSDPKTTSAIEFSDASFLESAFERTFKDSKNIFNDGPTIEIELGSIESGLRIDSISTIYSFSPGISSELNKYIRSSAVNNLYSKENHKKPNEQSNNIDSAKNGLTIVIKPNGSISTRPNSFTDKVEKKIDITPSKVNYKGIIGDVFDTTKAKPSKEEVLKMIDRIAPKHGIDPSIIKAIVQAESSFNNQCISRSGAVGLIQLMPETAKEMGLIVNNKVDERWDPEKNLEAGIKYIAKYHKIISNHFGKEDWDLTFAGYNCGPNRIIRTGGIPNIKETKDYVQKVNKFIKNYQ